MANTDIEAETSDLPWALTRPSSKPNSKADVRRNVNPKYRVDELSEPPPRFPGIRSLLPLPGGDLLTGGTDLKIRRWDHCRFFFAPSSVRLVYLIIALWFNLPWLFHDAAPTEVIAYVVLQ